MSKARWLIEALRVPGATVADVAARYGVNRSWVYRLWDRYRAEGDAAFDPRPAGVPCGDEFAPGELHDEWQSGERHYLSVGSMVRLNQPATLAASSRSTAASRHAGI